MRKQNKIKKPKEFIVLSGVIFLLFLIFINFINIVVADEFSLNYSSSNSVQFRQLKYDPYPVVPGEYFDIWISVQGKNKVDNWVFELIEDYPFSLDSDESAVRNYGKLDYPSLILKYKVRVDNSAFDGTYDLKIKYNYNGIEYYQIFNIEVEDSRTIFDAVIQEVSGSDVSIAVANAGKYVANSVVVRIPEQENFKATGTDGQMVGNLDSGDYTIVSFSLTSKIQRNFPTQNFDESSNSRLQNQTTNFQFDIYYTDAIGQRRIVNMELPFDLGQTITTSESGEISTEFPMSGNMRRGGFSWSIWYTIAIFTIIILTTFFVYKKYSIKIKELLKKLVDQKKDSDTSNEIPDWVKKVTDKSKKK